MRVFGQPYDRKLTFKSTAEVNLLRRALLCKDLFEPYDLEYVSVEETRPSRKGVFHLPYTTVDDDGNGLDLQLEIEVARREPQGSWRITARDWTGYSKSVKDNQLEVFMIQLRR